MYGTAKIIYFDKFVNENNIEDCYFEEFIEGTMINVFWDQLLELEYIYKKVILVQNVNIMLHQIKHFRYYVFRCNESLWVGVWFS